MKSGKDMNWSELFGKILMIWVNVKSLLVEAMVDSGAEVNLVTEDWYSDHLLSKKIVLYEVEWQISDAGGVAILCAGYILVELMGREK